MFLKSLLICLLFGAFAVTVWGTTKRPTLPEDQILERYRSLLLAKEMPDEDQALAYAEQIAPNGQWPDIDYSSQARAGWAPFDHLRRIWIMAQVLASPENSKKAKSALLRQSIDLALDHWCAQRYTSSNWWWNEIGTPQMMRDIIVLLGQELSGGRRKAALEVLGQYRMKGTGANLMWSAELALHHGCLTGNQQQVTRAAENIWSEVKCGDAEGIQADGSYYQHHERLQTFHYGRGYLAVVSEIAWQLRATPWSILEAQRNIVSDYILKGPQWMCRGIFTVPGTLDRSVSRKDHLQRGDLREIVRLWCEVDPQRQEAFGAFSERQSGKRPPLTGYRHFPKGDFTAYHRPAGSFFLKTISTRTLFTEAINNENQKGGPYLNCGDHYILQDGSEYHNLQPVWQWQHLPGLTHAEEENLKQTRTPFVGGIGHGQSGFTAMDYIRKNDVGASLSLRKSWFFHEDFILCLMGGMEHTGIQGEVVSSLEQCKLRGSVTARIDTAGVVELAPGHHEFKDHQWILHNGIGYIPLNTTSVKIFLGQREGSWHAINRQYEDTPVQASIFQILLNHEADTSSQGWVIVLDANASKLDAIVKQPSWQILRNDRDCQSVQFLDDGPAMAAFYEQGKVGENAGLTVDQPCLALWTEERLLLCDPTMQEKHVSVSWQSATHSVQLPKDGSATFLFQIDP